MKCLILRGFCSFENFDRTNPRGANGTSLTPWMVAVCGIASQSVVLAELL